MTYKDMLSKFHKRMEPSAINYFLIEKSRKEVFRERGFESDETLNLMILVLQFIMEKSLRSEECTRRHIEGYIMAIDRQCFQKDLSEDDAEILTRAILRDCLQNGGVPYQFTTYDYGIGAPQALTIRLIEDQLSAEDGMKRLTYAMTNQGYRFMFQAQEFEESMQVSMNEFRLLETVKRKNYQEARDTVDNLFHLCLSQIRRIEQFKRRMREDPATFDLDEYKNTYQSTFVMLHQQHETHGQILKAIGVTEKQILEDPDLVHSEKLMKDLNLISYIRVKLKEIMKRQLEVIGTQQELSRISDEIFNELLAIPDPERLSVKELLLEPFETGECSGEVFASLLRPLFKPRILKTMNPMVAYREQRLIEADGDVSNEKFMCDVNELSGGENLKAKKILAHTLQSEGVLDILLSHLLAAPEYCIHFSDVYAAVQGTPDHSRFVPNLRTLRYILVILYDKPFHDLTHRSISTGLMLNPPDELDLQYIINRLGTIRPEFRKIDVLHVNSLQGTDVIVCEDFKNDPQGEVFHEQLKMPDILFKLEVRK